MKAQHVAMLVVAFIVIIATITLIDTGKESKWLTVKPRGSDDVFYVKVTLVGDEFSIDAISKEPQYGALSEDESNLLIDKLTGSGDGKLNDFEMATFLILSAESRR